MNDQELEIARKEALNFLQRLADEYGAIVSSGVCTIEEIAQARACGKFFVDNEGLGYVLRPKEWRQLAEQSLFARLKMIIEK